MIVGSGEVDVERVSLAFHVVAALRGNQCQVFLARDAGDAGLERAVLVVERSGDRCRRRADQRGAHKAGAHRCCADDVIDGAVDVGVAQLAAKAAERFGEEGERGLQRYLETFQLAPGRVGEGCDVKQVVGGHASGQERVRIAALAVWDELVNKFRWRIWTLDARTDTNF